jgi:hypothetical protein
MVGVFLGLAISLVLQADQPSLEVEETFARQEPVRFDLTARIELRSGQSAGVAGSNLTDVEIDPVAAIRFPFRAGSLTLAYEPRLLIVAHEYPPQQTRTTSYLNRARLVLDTTPSQRWRVYVNGRFSYGENDFLPLSTVVTPTTGTGPPPVPPGTTPTAPSPATGQSTLPNTRILKVIDLDGSAGFVYSVGPRLGWRLSGGYIYSGGATAEVRATLPVQKGPNGSTGLQWSASRDDTMAFDLEGSNLRFSNGPESTIASLSITWTRAWSRSVGTDLLGGIGGIHATAPPAPGVPGVNNAPYPVGGLGLRHVWTTRFVSWQNRVTFLAAPAPDRLSGAVNERLSAGLHSALSPIPKLVLDVTVAASRAIGGTQRDARVEGRATYTLGPQFGVSLGGRMAWLEGSTLLGPQGFGWLALVSVGTSGGTSLFGASE